MGMIPTGSCLPLPRLLPTRPVLLLVMPPRTRWPLCAAVGCLGSLAGWTLLVGQSAKAAADDGLFGNVFSRVNRKGVPSSGLIIVAALMSLQVLATMSPTASQQFGKLASIAVIMTLLPYIYSCIAIKVLGYRVLTPNQHFLYIVIGFVGAGILSDRADRLERRTDQMVPHFRDRHHSAVFRSHHPQEGN